MSVAKVIEIIAESKQSWEDAVEQALKESTKTVRNVRSIYVKDMQAVVEKGKIVTYRVNCKVTFVVD